MKALPDPNRLKVLKMLQERVVCVCELQAALGLAFFQPVTFLKKCNFWTTHSRPASVKEAEFTMKRHLGRHSGMVHVEDQQRHP
jgi:DNA-binding transcriptional ArsR family regulator